MAVLEKIRSKTVFLIVIIGLALFAFVISDFIGRGKFSGGVPSAIGSVNGEDIPIGPFREQVENAQRQYAGAGSAWVAQQIWKQNVQQTLLNQQVEKLGLSVEKEQILAILEKSELGKDPNFTNEFGVFDANKFTAYIANIKSSNPQAYAQWKLQENAIVQETKMQMYFSLIGAGLGVTKAEAEIDYAQEKDMADINYVALPYSTIDDKSINVSDSEIEQYIKKHEKQFKQEAYRNIQYVVINERPSAEDIQKEKEATLQYLRPEIVFNAKTNKNDTIASFATVKNVREYVNRRSNVPFDSLFVKKSDLPVMYADTLFNLPIGKVFGPYEDGNTVKLSRMLAKEMNGAVNVSHILVAYEGSQGANPALKRTKEEAKARAEELLTQAKTPEANFDILAITSSDDPSVQRRGANLGYITKGQMVKPFEEFAFNNPAGTVGVVETDYGFHVIKVIDKVNTVQLATIVHNIEPSDKTINELFSKVTKFEMDVNEKPKEFGAIAKKSDLSVLRGDYLHINDDNIPGLGSNRPLVKWLFEKDTKIGDVKMFNSNSNYVVAQLVKKGEEGISSVADVRDIVKPILIKQKKAEILKGKAKGGNLEAIASANKTEIKTANGLTMKSAIITNEGREPRVVGAAFGLKQGATSKPIEGERGVYVIKLNSLQVATPPINYRPYAKAIETQRLSGAIDEVLNALESTAKIKNNLSTFY